MDKLSNENTMNIAGYGLCIPDEKLARSLGLTHAELELTVLPPMVKRRTSLATRMAISASEKACNEVGSTEMPAIFVSSCGELQTTDTLCQAIANESYPLSPTLFHNSVHNTAAGYWSIAVKTHQPMQAMSGLDDGLALGLLEAWGQIQTGADKVLLVSYEEQPPETLLPDYQWQPMAFALVLTKDNGPHRLSLPAQTTHGPSASAETFGEYSPVLKGLGLIQALQKNKPGLQQIEISSGNNPWRVELETV